MQAGKQAYVKVELSTSYKGRPRSARYGLCATGFRRARTAAACLGAWLKKGRPASSYLTEGEALVKAEGFAAEHSQDMPDGRRPFRAALA
jgi:hypothetical protein